MSASALGAHIAFRCDGNEQIGAGHVARCVPLAMAFAQLGWRVSFVGSYDGLADWLVRRANVHTHPATPECRCGIDPQRYDAAVLDSYLIAPASICELAGELPVVTLAESNRCETRGVLLDYHPDHAAPPSARLLVGPSFAPLDPAFIAAGRAETEIRRVLVTVGGSLSARAQVAQILPAVGFVLPGAEIVLAGGAQSETNKSNLPRVVELPFPSSLVDVLPTIDLAVTAAGLTAYELACAGIPQVAIAIAANQRRVVKCLHDHGLAPCLDLTSGDTLAGLPAALERLRSAEARRQLAERGKQMFDGRGAQRAAIALTELFQVAGNGGGLRRESI